jgi:hypothetical protein
LGSLGAEIDSFNVSQNGETIRLAFDTNSTLFSYVNQIFNGSNAYLAFSLLKKDETFDDTTDYYLALDSVHVSLKYHEQKMVVLENQNEDDNDSNLGGWLSLYYNTTRDSLESGDSIEVDLGNVYSVLTHKYEFTTEDVRHRRWNDVTHLIKWQNFEMVNAILVDGVNAKFKGQQSIDLSECEYSGVQFHDPWYIENDASQNPEAWSQPDNFIDIDVIAPSSTHDVFLNQDPDEGASYEISIPKLIDVSTNTYKVFYQWGGTGVNFDGPTSTTDRETPIVLHPQMLNPSQLSTI